MITPVAIRPLKTDRMGGLSMQTNADLVSYELRHVMSRLVMSTHTPNVFQMISRRCCYFSQYINQRRRKKQTNKQNKNKTLSVNAICRQLIKRELHVERGVTKHLFFRTTSKLARNTIIVIIKRITLVFFYLRLEPRLWNVELTAGCSVRVQLN